MKKVSLFLSLFTLFTTFFFVIPSSVAAVCPLCTIAVGFGLGLSRWLGIDDVISAVWIGGLLASMSMWFADWMTRKKWTIGHKQLISFLLFYGLTLPLLYLAKFIGIDKNTLWGIDKILLGIAKGTAVFYLAVLTDRWLRKINHGEVFIYYQKVIIPLLYLSLVSLVFYLIVSA